MYSQMEGGQVKITDDRLQQIAQALNLPVEHIKNFDDSTFFSNNSMSFDDGTTIQIHTDKPYIIELYERLLAEKDRRIADLEQRLEQFKQ